MDPHGAAAVLQLQPHALHTGEAVYDNGPLCLIKSPQNELGVHGTRLRGRPVVQRDNHVSRFRELLEWGHQADLGMSENQGGRKPSEQRDL